ncbi:ABC transporter ATP-binding protein [Amycolatopsis taiwanensis]|uniref:Peptide ABC transporter ATP-binding protein n=1 Tax=Amycolatopsis taiwanensis TaxID=342230 RepID=A0A9W6QV83_9PSEU|nr:ATP-binding cassette domain-containing protein [Amycolatopsis taiwanensis]GLY64759.1 peptide ABC transporter ATP-binding protein [Amycolatopsis taiwanensis]
MSSDRGFVLDNVSLTVGSTQVLDSISIRIEAGRCTAILGRSGSGKSTLLRTLTRLAEPTSGRVLLDGIPLTRLDVLALRRRVGLVAQGSVLLTDLVADDLRVGRPELTDVQVADLLAGVGLPAGFAYRRTNVLSGGEAQRVCLARALAVEPEILLLDEPTSALDGVTVSFVARLARGHVADGGTVVLVSHDLAVVRSIAERVLVLDTGQLVAAGRPEDVDYLEAG